METNDKATIKQNSDSLPAWEELPHFGIYRDQLIEIVTAALAPILQDAVAANQILTPSMINNYVKWNFIPKPTKKKYEREHIVSCIVLSALKQVLPLTVVDELLSHRSSEDALADATVPSTDDKVENTEATEEVGIEVRRQNYEFFRETMHDLQAIRYVGSSSERENLNVKSENINWSAKDTADVSGVDMADGIPKEREQALTTFPAMSCPRSMRRMMSACLALQYKLYAVSK